MFNLRKNNLSTSQAGETLFGFLKRKKGNSQQPLHSKSNNTQLPQPDESFSNIYAEQNEAQQTERINSNTYRTSRRNKSINLTPRKVTFAEQEEHRQQKQATNRTFIDLISPLKAISNNQLQLVSSISKQAKAKCQQSSSNKKSNAQQTFNRKQLNKSIQMLIDTLWNLIKVGKNLKQKSHCLFVQLTPVIKIAQQEAQGRQIKKKIQSAKDRLRLMQHQFEELDVKNARQMIQQFHRSLSDHLKSQQAKYRLIFQKSSLEGFAKLKQQKDSKIFDLQQQKRQLQNKIQVLDKKLQKMSVTILQLKQNKQNEFSKQRQEYQTRITNLQQQIKQKDFSKGQIQQKLKLLQQQQIQNNKKLKDALYAKQMLESKFSQQVSNAKSAREQFLLDQLMVLKKQFHSDMKKLTQLYAVKEAQNMVRIENQNKQIHELRSIFESTRDNNQKIGNDSQNLKGLINKYRKQNECLVTDMHRINQQLYQHWAALKDVKTLATRLHLFAKFARIYEDLGFNDLLFS